MGPTLQTAASFSAGEISSRNHGFPPKENVPTTILKSIHPIHKPDAFSKAESRLHMGVSLSRDIGPGCGGTSLWPPIKAPPAHPGTFLYSVLFFGCDINNNVFCINTLCQIALPRSVSSNPTTLRRWGMIIPVPHLRKQTCTRERAGHGWRRQKGSQRGLGALETANLPVGWLVV